MSDSTVDEKSKLNPQDMSARVARRALNSALNVPDDWAKRLFGEPAKNDRGQPMDRQTYLLLNLMDMGSTEGLHEQDPEMARSIYRHGNRIMQMDPVDLYEVRDVEVPGDEGPLNARWYQPVEEPRPTALYLHGGGFVIGDVEGYDSLCRYIAREANICILSLDYRLAPENPFPAGPKDCIAAFRYLIDETPTLGGDDSTMMVMGDSAGATLSTVISQAQIDDGRRRPDHQFLLYPTTDLFHESPSRIYFHAGYVLEEPTLKWFGEAYLLNSDGEISQEHPWISPIFYDRMEEMPPTTLITAGFDPLRDEGKAFADALQEAGVDVDYHCYEHLIHGFANMGGLVDAAKEAVDEICQMIDAVVGGDH